MDGHQRDLVVGILFILHVHGTQKRNILEKITQRDHRQILSRNLDIVRSVSQHLLEIFVLALFHKSLHAVYKFLHVCSLGLPFYAGIALVQTQNSGLHRNGDCQITCILLFHSGRKTGNHTAKGPEFVHCGTFQSETVQII